MLVIIIKETSVERLVLQLLLLGLAEPAFHHFALPDKLCATSRPFLQGIAITLHPSLDEFGTSIDNLFLSWKTVLGVQVRRVEVANVELFALDCWVQQVRWGRPEIATMQIAKDFGRFAMECAARGGVRPFKDEDARSGAASSATKDQSRETKLAEAGRGKYGHFAH